MASVASKFVSLAGTQLGTLEGRNADGTWNNRQKYGVWYGMNGVPWCNIFVSWCAYYSGNTDIIPRSAYVPSTLEWYRSRGLTGLHWPPGPGDLGFVMDGSGHPTHIFIVEKWLSPSTVQTIEGNVQSGGRQGVFRLRRQDSRTNKRLVYAHPKFLR